MSENANMDIVIEKIKAYIRKRRSLLVDCQHFHQCNNQDSENAGEYFAALSRIDKACDYQDSHTCSRRGQRDITPEMRKTHLRHRLICRLRNTEMQCQILEDQYGSNLSLYTVLRICAAQESPEESKMHLSTNQQPTFMVAGAAN